MEVSGKVKALLQQQTFGSGFTKREVVITTEEQYPQSLIIEFVQEKVALLSDLSIGDSVTISINLRGREWQAPDGTVKYFNSIQGWKLEKGNAGVASASGAPLPTEEDYSFSAQSDKDEPDDLPF